MCSSDLDGDDSEADSYPDVVWAIREGRQCAREVDKTLMGYTNLAL